MELWNAELQSACFSLERSTLREKFLHDCLIKDIVPKGLQLKLNLSLKPSDVHVVYAVHRVLVTASTSILETVHAEATLKLEENSEHVERLRIAGNSRFGERAVKQAVYQAKLCCKTVSDDIVRRHREKFAELARNNDPPFDPEKVGRGSFRIKASPLTVHHNRTDEPNNQIPDIVTYRRTQPPTL